MLNAALGATEIFVGVTSGPLAARNRVVSSWEVRAGTVAAYLREQGFAGELTLRELTGPMGPAKDGPFDAIIVSPETAGGAAAINQFRKEHGLPLLQITVVPHLLGEDKLPISATAVSEGRIDRNGKRMKEIRVVVGSGNLVKVRGAEQALQAFLDVHVAHLAVASGVPEQPVGPQTLQGARNRAAAAMDAEADYAIGIEAGLVQLPGMQRFVDMQAVVVLDRNGRETIGWGPGFMYPHWVEERALGGEMISDIVGPVVADERIGGTIGAVGYLSAGAMERTELTRIGVTMALLPRSHSLDQPLPVAGSTSATAPL